MVHAAAQHVAGYVSNKLKFTIMISSNACLVHFPGCLKLPNNLLHTVASLQPTSRLFCTSCITNHRTIVLFSCIATGCKHWTSKPSSVYKDGNIHENITHKPKFYISDKKKKEVIKKRSIGIRNALMPLVNVKKLTSHMKLFGQFDWKVTKTGQQQR